MHPALATCTSLLQLTGGGWVGSVGSYNTYWSPVDNVQPLVEQWEDSTVFSKTSFLKRDFLSALPRRPLRLHENCRWLIPVPVLFQVIR